jgi:hypothetical protein
MNLKSESAGPQDDDSFAFSILITPRHFRRPKVEGSTSARMWVGFGPLW